MVPGEDASDSDHRQRSTGLSMSERESRHVRVGGLPDGAADERIIAHFNPYGNVAKLSRPCDGSGDVVVSYNDIRSAKKAIDAINERASPRGKFDGFALRIAFSESIPSTPTSVAGGRTSARSSASSDQPSTVHNVVLPTPLASTSHPLPQVIAPAGPKLGVAQADIGGSSKTASKLAAVTKRVLGSAPAVIVADPLHKNASRTLYVGNLPSGVTDDQLRAIFIPYGHILNYDVKSRHGASPTAFIEFTNIRAVAQILRAVAGNSRFTIGNKRLELNWGNSVRTTKLWIGALPSTCSQQYLLSKLRVIERAEEVTELIYDERHCEALALYKTTDASQFAYKRIKSRGLTFPCEASDDEDQCCEVDFCSERLHDFFVDRQFGRVPRAGRSRINATAAPPDPPLGAVSDVSSIRRESSIDEPTPSATMVPPDPIITARTSTGHQPPRERGRTESASRSVIGGNGTHRSRVSIPSTAADRPVDDEVDRRGGGVGRKVIRPPSPDASGRRMANRDAERADRRSGNNSRECESRSGSRGRKDFNTPRRDHSDPHHRNWDRQQSLSSVRERGDRDEKSKSVSSSDRHQSSGVGSRRRDEYVTQASSASSNNKRVRSSSSSSSTTSSSTTCSSRSTSSGSSTSVNRTRKTKAVPTSVLPDSSASQNPSSMDGGRLRHEARATASSTLSYSRSERRERKEHSPLSLLCPPPPAPIIGARTPRSRQQSGSSSASSMLERSSVAGKGIEEKLAVIQKLRDRRRKEESEVGRGEQRKPEGDRKVEPKEPTSSNIHLSSSSASRQPASHPTSGQATSSRTPVKTVPTSPLYRHMSDPRLRKSDSSAQCPPISLSIPRFGKAFLTKYKRTSAYSTSNNQYDEWNTASFEEPHVGREVAAAPCSSRMMSVSSLHCEESVAGPGDSGTSVSCQQWTASTESKQEGVSLLSRDSSTESMLDTPPPMVAVTQFDISAFRLSCFLGRGDILLAWRDRLAVMRVRLDEAEKEKERVLSDELSHQSSSTKDYEGLVSSVSLQEELERFRTAKELKRMKTAPATHPHHFDSAATKGQELSYWSAPPTQPSGAFFPDLPVLTRRETENAVKESPSSFGFGLFDASGGGAGRDQRSRESPSISQSPSHPPVGKYMERNYGAALHRPAAVSHSTSNRSSIEPQSANTAVTSAKQLTHVSKTAVADPRRKSTYNSPALTSFSPLPKNPSSASTSVAPRIPPKEANRHDGNQLDDFFHKQASSWPLPSAIASAKQEKRLTSSSSTDQTKSPSMKTPTGPSSSSQSLHQRQSTSGSSKVMDRLDKSAREHKTSKHPPVSTDVRSMSKEHAKRKEKERHAGKSDSELKEKVRRKKKRLTSANSSEDSEEDTDDEETVFGLGGIDMEEQRRIMQQITSGKCGTTMYDRVKQRSSAMRPDQQRKKEQALKRIEKMRERSGLKKKKLQRVQLPSSSSADDSEESSRVSAGRSERHQAEVAVDVSDDNVSLASHSTVRSRSEAPIPIKVAAKTCIVGDVKVEMAPVEVESGNTTERKTTKDHDASFRSRTTPKKGMEDAKKRTKKGNKNELPETTPKSQSNSLIVDNDSSPAEASSSGRSGSESEGEACIRRLRKELLKYHRSSEEEAEAESRFEAAMGCIFPNEDRLDLDDSSSTSSSSSSPSLDERTSHAPILKKEAEEFQAAAVKNEDSWMNERQTVVSAAEQPPTKRAKFSISSDQATSVSEGIKEPTSSTVTGRRPTMEKTPSVEDGKRKEVSRRGRPPKTTRKHSVDETETKRQEEKRIVEILHSLCPKTNSPSTDVMTTAVAATATANYTPPPSTMVKQASGTRVENVEMEDILGIAFASADVCSGFEVVDQGRIGAEGAGVSTTSTTPTTITSPSIVTPAASDRAPVVKRGRGRPPKNKASLLKNQSKSGSFEEPAAQTTVTSEEELKRRAEMMRKMREEEEAAAAMSLTQGGVQEPSRDPSKEVETHVSTKEGRNESSLEAEPTSAAVHEIHEVADIKSPKYTEPYGASRGGYVEVDAEHLLQQQQPPQLHHQYNQQQATIDETERQRVAEEAECEKAVTDTKCREEDEERRRLEEEHEDRLTATVDAVIASSKIAAADTTISRDILLRSRCATMRPITVTAATPQMVKPPHSPPAASYALESMRGEANPLSSQPDVNRSQELPSPVHASRRTMTVAAVNASHYQNKPTTAIPRTQLPSVPSSQRLPSSAHPAFLNAHGTASPGVSGELTRPDSNVPQFPANTCAGTASIPAITAQQPVAASIPAEIPLALPLYGHLLGNPPANYSQLLSPNHQQHATFLMNQLIASQRWNPAAVASIQQANIAPSAPLPTNSIPIDMLQQIRAEIERQQQADAGGAHLARSPSTPLHQPFNLPQSHQLHHSPSLSNHPTELQPLVEADSNVEQIQSQYPVLWQGRLTLKHAHTFVEMHKICGNGDFVYAMEEELMSQIDGYKTIKITQKMRLSEDQLQSILLRMSNDEDYIGLCCIPCGRNEDEITSQSESMRHSFIEFLMERQAAGIINQGPSGAPASCVVHVFPPVKFVYEIMMRHAPDLLVRVEESQTSYLFVIIFANQ